MPRPKKPPVHQVGSLFAGMGGFCLAFAKEGFNVAWANEKDRFAVETYRSNFPATATFHKPIEEFSVIDDDLSAVDVLTAGFPCQPFSVAGSKLGFNDERGRSFFEIMRLIREFGNDRPKILLFENVPHLLAHDRGRTFNRIAQEIQATGYWFMPRQNTAVLNTKIHTNIPQNRERLYMVALSWDHFRTNVFHFPEPEAETLDYNTVFLIGPDQIEEVSNAIDYIQNLHKPKDSDDAYSEIQGFKDLFVKAQSLYGEAKQPPDDTGDFCLLGNSPPCTQLLYNGGFNSVYQRTRPVQLPAPVLIFVMNGPAGVWSSGVFNFEAAVTQ